MAQHEAVCIVLNGIADSPELLEVGRLAVEDALIMMRDSRISQIRNNGLVIHEKNGEASDIIRLGPEGAIRIALRAIAKYIEEETTKGDKDDR